MFDDLSWIHGLLVLPLGVAIWWALRTWVIRKDQQVDKLKDDLIYLQGAFGEIRVEHKDIKEDIRGHIEREENMLWPKVEDLKDRLVRIESAMPNGELKTLIYRFGKLEDSLTKALDHVQEHDRESEQWKSRIRVLEDKVE